GSALPPTAARPPLAAVVAVVTELLHRSVVRVDQPNAFDHNSDAPERANRIVASRTRLRLDSLSGRRVAARQHLRVLLADQPLSFVARVHHKSSPLSSICFLPAPSRILLVESDQSLGWH